MKVLRLAFRRERAMPMLALVFATLVCGALVFARILWTGNIRYSFLLWNLLLAWLPLVFGLLAHEEFENSGLRNWRFLSFAGAWLLFFPNAPYIFTDLIHLTTHFYRHFWVDLVLILIGALTGLVLGFVSLYLMQSIVARIAGVAAGWVFITVVTALSAFGIYLGRFLRLNSWDVIFKPVEVYRGIGNWVADPLSHPTTTFAFPVLFAVFLFIAYVMLYALTHLQPIPASSASSSSSPRER